MPAPGVGRKITMPAAAPTIGVQTARLVILKGVRYLVSVMVFILSARHFGFEKERDYWVLSTSFVLIVSQLFFGPIQDIYRIHFTSEKSKHGLQKALRAVCSLNALILISCFGITLVTAMLRSQIASWIAPGFHVPQQNELSRMIAMVFPTLAFQQLMMLLSGVLNSTDHFEFPEAAQIASSVIVLLFIWLGQERLGIYSLIGGSYAGYACAILMMLTFLKRKFRGDFLFWTLPDRSVGAYLARALPFWGPFFAGQMLGYTEKALASFLPQGQVSLFDYGRKLVELPMGVIIGVSQSLFAVKLTALLAAKGRETAIDLARDYLRLLLCGSIPIGIVFLCCGEALYTILFAATDSAQPYRVLFSRTMAAFSIAIPALCIYAVSTQTLIAFGRQRLSALLSGVFTLCTLLIDLLGFQAYGVPWLALSWSFFLLFSSMVQLSFVFSRLGMSRSEILRDTVFFPLLFYAFMWVLSNILPYPGPAFGEQTIGAWMYIFSSAVASLLFLIGWIFYFQLPEQKQLRLMILKIYDSKN